MASKTFTAWTCDGCGEVRDVDPTAQPPGWVRLSMATPPLHAEPIIVGDLCGDCWTQISDAYRALAGEQVTA